jgi:hypothetical protein
MSSRTDTRDEKKTRLICNLFGLAPKKFRAPYCRGAKNPTAPGGFREHPETPAAWFWSLSNRLRSFSMVICKPDEDGRISRRAAGQLDA